MSRDQVSDGTVTGSASETGPGDLVRYARSGGRPPSDDEWLEVAVDGSWVARRTVSGSRAGRFAGHLERESLSTLGSEVAAAVGAGDAEVPTPRHGATETIELRGAAATLGSNEDAPGPWGPLVRRLRILVQDDVVVSPVAGLALEASVAAASLSHLGSEVVRLEPASVRLRVVRVDSDGIALGEWEAPAAGAPGTPGTPGTAPQTGFEDAGPGWSLALPFEHDLAPQPGDILQVRVLVRVDDEGTRTVRLYAPVRV